MTDHVKEFETWADNNPEFAQPFPVPYVAPTDTINWMISASNGFNDYKFLIADIFAISSDNNIETFHRMIQEGLI